MIYTLSQIVGICKSKQQNYTNQGNISTVTKLLGQCDSEIKILINEIKEMLGLSENAFPWNE